MSHNEMNSNCACLNFPLDLSLTLNELSFFFVLFFVFMGALSMWLSCSNHGIKSVSQSVFIDWSYGLTVTGCWKHLTGTQ